MEGYITIHRKIVDWEWYKDIPTRVLFEHLLLTANWKDKKWHRYSCKTWTKNNKSTTFIR